MANSRVPGPLWTNPLSLRLPDRTPGSLGRKDAADPLSRVTAHPGDSPGALGRNDHAALMASKLKLRLDHIDAGSPGPGSSMELFRATSEHVTNLGKEGQVSVWKIGGALLFRTRSMAVDIDGAPNAYHPATHIIRTGVA